MAKRVAAPKLQEDIQTDEELYLFLEKPGLLVLDIYSEWCGPCLGMVLSLGKLKLDVGGDHLSYAICKADTIEAFKRFRRKSEPTWLFVTNHKAVNIMFGSDVPKLISLIYNELKKLKFKTRNYYDLNEYQPEELKRRQIKEDAKNKAITMELEQKERERWTYLTEVTNTIMDNLTDMGVTIFGPQVQRNFMKEILQKADQLKILCWDRKTVEICREHFEIINIDCPNPISDDVLEQLEGREMLVCYWKVPGNGPAVSKILQNLAIELQTPQTQPSNADNEYTVIPPILQPMEIEVKVAIEGDDILSHEHEDKLVAAKRSPKEYFAFEKDDLGEDEGAEEQLFNPVHEIEKELESKKRTKKIQIPPIWVPNNHRTHAALIYTYFRNQTVTFLPPDPIPEPPYVIMAFDAHKKKDLIPHVERYRHDVPMYGFFTSDDADKAEYITNSSDKYKAVTENDKIVFKVQRATSRTVLNLVTYGPSYVTPNHLISQDEVLKFFPPAYKTAEQVAKEEADMLKIETTNKMYPKMTEAQNSFKSNEINEIDDSLKDTDKMPITNSIDKISSNSLKETFSDLYKTTQVEAA